MEKAKHFVQGDVFLKVINEIPEDAKQKDPNEHGYVLSEGESTGHYHAIPPKYAAITKVYEQDGRVYLAVLAAVELTHPEHKTIVVPIGNYEVGHVREYDPFLEETRRVLD